MPLEGDWDKAEKALDGLGPKFMKAVRKAMLVEGQTLRGEVVKGLDSQAPAGQSFTPLSQITLAMRRFGDARNSSFKGSKALIRRADLRNGIVSVQKGDEVFVGVLRTAHSKTGESLVNIAEEHENGVGAIVVPITPKSSRYFHAALAAAGIESPKSDATGGGVAIAIIRIPARPFLGPVFEKFAKPEDVRARMYHRISNELNLGGEGGGHE
jgi:hypothetical protein